jgi:hypothetical protein
MLDRRLLDTAIILVPFVKYQMAGGLGFEPRLAESESAVLPLDDPPRVINV